MLKKQLQKHFVLNYEQGLLNILEIYWVM